MSFREIFITFFIICMNLVFAQKNEIDNFLRECNEKGLFTGSALVTQGSKVIYEGAFGQADRENNINNEPETRFNAGSITKQFTTVMILQLLEEGTLRSEAVITEYIKNYRKDTGNKITIDHLLRHKSGIKPFTSIRGVDDFLERRLTDEEQIAILHSSDLISEPDEKYEYNNTGYCLLRFIIKEVTGKTYEENLNERILKPLGMKNTGLIYHETTPEKFAEGYILDLGGYRKPRYLNQENFWGTGGIYSTVHDLWKFNRGIKEHKLFPEKYDNLIYEPFISTRPGNGHALLWDITTIPLGPEGPRVKFFQFNGAAWGYNCFNTILAEKDYQIILMTNAGHDTNIWAVHSGIMQILHDVKVYTPRIPVSSYIIRNYETDSLASLVEEAEKLLDEQRGLYTKSEYKLNMLGYRLMRQNKPDEAILLFKLNTRLFPESFNVFDSLGEAYMAAGNKEMAVKNYRKSLELNPENKNAEDMLKSLNFPQSELRKTP